jgi:GNAT superfamily N-acetyltransferase
MTDNLRIRRGTTGDADTIIGMIDEAADWLRGKGTDQWARPWPNRAARDGRVRRGLRNGHTWIAEDAGRPIATITYRPHGNRKLWTRREDQTPAVYVSRLIVTRSAAGFGVGAAMIDWAAAQAVNDWNAQWTRIDVWTTNVALHNYYEKRGFRHLRIAQCQAEDYPSAALFQKPTSEIDLVAAQNFDVDPGRKKADRGGEKELVGAAGR